MRVWLAKQKTVCDGLRRLRGGLPALRKAPQWATEVSLFAMQAHLHRPHERTLGHDVRSLPRRPNLALLLLLEGNSIRSTERITQLDRNTIMRLLVLAGARCVALLDTRMRNVRAKYIQADEIWTYVGKKDKHVRVDDPDEFGNQWVFVAMDEQTKLVVSFVIGKRTRETTYQFLADLQERLADARLHSRRTVSTSTNAAWKMCSRDKPTSRSW